MRTIVFLLCMCFGVQGLKGVTNVTLGSLPLKERNRRLIPYMNYYIGQQQNPQYRQLIAIPVPPAQQYRQQQLQRFIPQQQTPLTRMITQNYLALSKQLAGNPRLQMRVLPQNVHPVDPKYLIPVPNQHQNIVRIPLEQYHKQQNVQYVRPQQQEQQQYARPEEENDYDPREEEPPVVQYVKPPPDVLLQYVKPEVQQYITKIRGQQAVYTKQQEQEDYNQQQNIPVQFVAKAPRPQQYAEQVEPIYGQRQQVQEAPTQYFQKPIIRYFHKLALPPGSKLAPLPAEIPEYITRPNNKQAENEQKEEPTVTIMQSQEIDVEPLPSTPAPTPKYHATYVEKPESLDDFRTFQPSQHYPQEEQKNEDLDPEIVDKNLNEVLQGLSISKTLPDRITTENLGESISKLSKILRILQRAHSLPQAAKDLITYPKPVILKAKVPKIQIQPQSHANDGSTPGRPGIDYPNYDEIPPTRFSCKDQRYKGFFGDPETGCQVWHYCDLNGGQASFLCPNGTIFSQAALTCDWWFNVKCASTTQLYVLNERLYKYILPHKPSFPEDYSGPLVDHYLTLKFKEIEEKNKNKTEESKESPKEEEYEPPFSIDVETQNKVRSAS